MLIREIIYGNRREITYWEITTNKKKKTKNGKSFVKTNIKGSRVEQKKKIGNLYGQRTWVEYWCHSKPSLSSSAKCSSYSLSAMGMYFL